VRNNRRRRRSQSGFTLIELLLVIIIISTLAAIVVPQLAGRGEDARRAAAKKQIADFETALDLYEADNGFYPSTEQGLFALREKPTGSPEPLNWNERGYLKKDVPQDPWGNEFVYRNPGLVNPTGYDIVSPGLDGRLDTEDDIGNWNEVE